MTSILISKVQKYKVHLCIFFAALVIRIVYLVLFFDPIKFNQWMPEGIDERAVLLSNGGQHYLPTAWASSYVIFAFFYKIFSFLGVMNLRLEIMAVISSILGAFSCVIVFLIAKKVFKKNTLAVWISTVLFILYYPYIYFNSLLLAENIFIPLFLFLFLRIVTDAKLTRGEGILQGIILGILTILRPNIAVFIPIYLAWIFYFNRDKIKSIAKNFMFDLGVGVVIVVAFVSSINYFFDKHHNFNFTSNGGLNAALNWCQPRRIQYELEDGENFWFSPPVFHSKPESTDINTDVHFSNQGYYYRLALDCLKDNPERIVTNLVNIKNTFNSELYPDFDPFEHHDNLVTIWKIILGVLTFGFILNLFDKKHWKMNILLFLTLASLLFLIYLLNPGEERYLAPFFFIFCIWGVSGLLNVIKFVDDKLTDISKSNTNKKIFMTWLKITIPLIFILTLIAYIVSKF